MGNDRHVYDLNTFSSDEAMLPCRIGDWEDGGLWQNIFLHRWGTMNDLTKNSWDFLYEQIGKCNQSVDKLQAFAEGTTGRGIFQGLSGRGPCGPCVFLL